MSAPIRPKGRPRATRDIHLIALSLVSQRSPRAIVRALRLGLSRRMPAFSFSLCLERALAVRLGRQAAGFPVVEDGSTDRLMGAGLDASLLPPFSGAGGGPRPPGKRTLRLRLAPLGPAWPGQLCLTWSLEDAQDCPETVEDLHFLLRLTAHLIVQAWAGPAPSARPGAQALAPPSQRSHWEKPSLTAQWRISR